MMPNHILDDLRPDQRVSILARLGELHFFVHEASISRVEVQDYANRDGSEILAAHLQDKEVILAFVSAREKDIGGEG
jgi:hypothetical protein